MTEKKKHSDPTTDLRKRAEKKILYNEFKDIESLNSPKTNQILHELLVHQIELEMQNEELKRAQEELEASRLRYFDLYDLAPVGYFTISEKGLIMEANLTGADLLGVLRSHLIKQPLSYFILPENQDIYYRHRKKLIETGSAQMCELRLKKKDGVQWWARLDMTLIHDSDNIPLCRVVIIDITGRKKAEKVILESERLKAVEEVASGVAHDFNNFLQSIFGNIELALLEPEISKQVREYLEAIKTGAEEAAARVKQLQRFGGKIQGKSEYFLVDINMVVQDVIAQARSIWKDYVQKNGKNFIIEKKTW